MCYHEVMKVWCLDPQSGGTKIPREHYSSIEDQIETYARKQAWYHPSIKIQARFRNQFCYLDSIENGGIIAPLVRLRYFGTNRWTLAFYTYSNEKYKPCIFRNGSWYGSIEGAIDIGSIYLTQAIPQRILQSEEFES